MLERAATQGIAAHQITGDFLWGLRGEQKFHVGTSLQPCRPIPF
jgi:hypothetical protein